jgi:hypothetical protein
VNLDLDDAQTRALLGLLVEAIEADRYPLSPRVRVLRAILAKFGELAPKTTAPGQTADRRGARSGPCSPHGAFVGGEAVVVCSLGWRGGSETLR